MEPYVLTSEELKIQNALMDKADAIVEAEIGEILASEEGQGSAIRARHRIRKPHARVALAALVTAALMVTGAFAGSRIITLYPYAITANNKVICYVNDNDDGAAAVQKAVSDLAGDEENVVLFSVGDGFNVSRSYEQTKGGVDVKTADEAAECISEAVREDPAAFPDIAVASTRTDIRSFTPEPTYVKDEEAFAGTTVEEQEGRDGSKAVTVDSVTVNGEVVKETDVSEEILDEGESAVIVRGTLGLPEGEDWETYEGNPVYRDGEELVTTARSYVGKVQYVRGGTSLKTGVDCVGFVIAVYAKYGIKLSPHLRKAGVGVSYSDAQPGDILCFTHNGGSGSHYGIYIGDGKMVDAANPREDVRIAKVSAGGKLIGVRRIPHN